MTENQKNKDEGWVLLGTKVPPHIGQLFRKEREPLCFLLVFFHHVIAYIANPVQPIP